MRLLTMTAALLCMASAVAVQAGDRTDEALTARHHFRHKKVVAPHVPVTPESRIAPVPTPPAAPIPVPPAARLPSPPAPVAATPPTAAAPPVAVVPPPAPPAPPPAPSPAV